jgi:hypothetical protein
MSSENQREKRAASDEPPVSPLNPPPILKRSASAGPHFANYTNMKRTAPPSLEGAQPNKRQKQRGQSHVPGSASSVQDSRVEAVATARGERIQTEGATPHQAESLNKNNMSNEGPRSEGSGSGAAIGADTTETHADSDTNSSPENESNVSRKAQKRAKLRNKWLDTVNSFVNHGNKTGFFSKELREKSHNSRPPMLPDERSRLMEDLNQSCNTSKLQGQREDIERSVLRKNIGLDFMGAFSATVDSPKDAAAFLGMNLKSLKISPESTLKLRIDQVQNTAFMVQKAEGILKGCVNANDHGTGKTVEALASIFFLAQMRQARPEFDGHKATFILCPHQALRGWQQTHANYFSALLNLHICSKALPPGEHSQLISNPPSSSALDAFLATLSPSDPQTSRTVILCTYDELSSREFLAEREKERCREKELSVRSSKLTEESLEALKVAQKPRLYDLNFDPKTIGTLVADEAHEIKHPKSRKAQAAYLLDPDIHFLLTASPVENKVSDFRGLLFAFYNKEWQMNWPIKQGYKAFLRMFDDDFNPFKIIKGKEYVPKDAEREYVRALRNRQHLWRLSPHLYRWLGHKMKFGPEFSRRVLGSIFHLCLLRRGVDSVATLPSSGPNTISGIFALPPLSIKTIEISKGPDEQNHGEMAGMAFNRLFREDNEDKAAGAARVINANEIPLAAIDNFWDTFLNQITADFGLANVRRISETGESSTSPLPGIDDLLQSNTDAGMSFYYEMTRRGTDPVHPPADRATMVRYLTRQSPKLRWLLVKLGQLNQRGEKVIVYCVHRLTQWLLEGVCSMAEFEVLSLRSKPKHGDETRAKIINEFNNPSKRHDLLLSTFRILGHSVDLHVDCHNMIIFELPDNVPDMLSAIGRIRRVGQTEPQEVSILTMKDSYDDFTLHRQSRKYATAILAFGVLGKQLDTLAWHIHALVERYRAEYFKGLPEYRRDEILERIEKMFPALEAVKLLAAGEQVRRQLGAQHNRSHIPWHCRHSFIFGRQKFPNMKLADFSGTQMGNNTAIGREIVHQAAQLPPVGPPTAEVENLAASLKD